MSTSKLNQISPHVYWLSPDATTDRPTLGAIVGKYGTVIVDAGNSPAHAQILLSELSKLRISPLKYLMLTHWHWDHVFGTAAFDLPTFAHQETKRIIEEMSDLDWSDEALDSRVEQGIEIEFCRDMIKAEWPDRTALTIKAPDISFTGQIEVDVGDISCQVVHVGGDHAGDSSIVYVPQDKIVFLSDCLYEDLYHGARNYTPKKLFPLIDQVVSFEAEFYVLGHHLEPLTKVEMVEFTALLKRIGRKVEQIGDHRPLVMQKLEEMMGSSLEEETIEIADAFLAGLRK